MAASPLAAILAKKMAKKWKQNTQNKGEVLVENLLDVINAGVNPMKLAAEKDKKAIAKLRQVFESGTWRKIMESVDIGTYKTIVQQVSAQAYNAAVEAKAPKYDRFAKSWAPILADITAKVRAMPDETDAQREQRMLAMVRSLRKAKGAWRGGGA